MSGQMRVVAVAIGLWAICAPAIAQDRDDSPLALSGYSLSQAFEIPDDGELQTFDKTIERLLYRLMKSSPRTRQRASEFAAEITWDQLLEHPEEYRFWMCQRTATLKSIQSVEIPDAISEAAIRSYWAAYAVAAGPDGTEIPIVVLTRKISQRLPRDTTLSEPIQFSGLLYRRVLPPAVDPPLSPDSKWLVFVADRVAWLPQATTLANASQIRLAAQGFDISLLDQVKAQNGRRLTETDSEAFFQMMVAVDRAHRRGSAPPEAISLTELLRTSSEQIGNYTQLTAVCRTCTPTEIPDPDVRERLGIDRYYQLMLFPNLDQKVSVTEGEEQVTYDRYPVTICCTGLPEGMEPADLERKTISVGGHFYRIWKYDSEIAQQADLSGTVSPLILAGPPQLVGSAIEALDRSLTILVAAVIFVFVGLIGSRVLPAWVLRHLRYTAVAVLPGLVAPLVVWPPASDGVFDAPRFTAALVTIVVGLWTRNVVLSIALGATCLYAGLYLVG